MRAIKLFLIFLASATISAWIATPFGNDNNKFLAVWACLTVFMTIIWFRHTLKKSAQKAEKKKKPLPLGSIEHFKTTLALNGTRFCCCVCQEWKPRKDGAAVLYEKTGKHTADISGAICKKCIATYEAAPTEIVAEIIR